MDYEGVTERTGDLLGVKVRRLADHRVVGVLQWDRESWDSYADGREPGVSYPEGTGRAGDVLAFGDLEDFGIEADTVVYFELED